MSKTAIFLLGAVAGAVMANVIWLMTFHLYKVI
jgi:hypothetical protein